MNQKAKQSLVPALLAGAAVYFGIKGKGSCLGDLTKEAVNRMINDNVDEQKAPSQRPPKQNTLRLRAPKSKKKKTIISLPEAKSA